MPVVSNTSPIWNLAAIERLDLLHEQFSDLYIPDDVWDELQVMRDCPEVSRIQQARDAQ
jgi:predicted nucleic acid-binding protein